MGPSSGRRRLGQERQRLLTGNRGRKKASLKDRFQGHLRDAVGGTALRKTVRALVPFRQWESDV